METLLIANWEVDYDADYDPFEDDVQGRKLENFTWRYYGWSDIGGSTVCGNASVLVPKTYFYPPERIGEHIPR